LIGPIILPEFLALLSFSVNNAFFYCAPFWKPKPSKSGTRKNSMRKQYVATWLHLLSLVFPHPVVVIVIPARI